MKTLTGRKAIDIRKKLYIQNPSCFYCDCDLDFSRMESVGRLGRPYACIEHVTPISRGGTNNISNLKLSCNSCNVQKGNKTFDEYMEWLNRSFRWYKNTKTWNQRVHDEWEQKRQNAENIVIDRFPEKDDSA